LPLRTPGITNTGVVRSLVIMTILDRPINRRRMGSLRTMSLTRYSSSSWVFLVSTPFSWLMRLLVTVIRQVFMVSHNQNAATSPTPAHARGSSHSRYQPNMVQWDGLPFQMCCSFMGGGLVVCDFRRYCSNVTSRTWRI